MEFHRGNTNSGETTTPAAASHGGEAFDQNQGVYGWSEEFKCDTMYGYLAPMPLSATPLPTEEEEEEKYEAKKRRTTEGDEELFFRLYKFSEVVDQYILEMHEVRTGRVERSHLVVEESNGKWKVAACDLKQGTYVVLPVQNDPFTLQSPPNHTLSLQDRLTGWTVEKRKRGNGKEDKFYYHGGKQYRSFVEVTTFILYTTKSKEDLKSTMIIPTDQNSDQDKDYLRKLPWIDTQLRPGD